MGGAIKENRLLRKTGRKGKGRRPRRLKTEGERGKRPGRLLNTEREEGGRKTRETKDRGEREERERGQTERERTLFSYTVHQLRS